MTYITKAKKVYPDLTENEIIEDICPGELFPCDFKRFKNCDSFTYDDCERCWNREVPEVEK